VEEQAARLKEEGHTIETGRVKKKLKVKDYQKSLGRIKDYLRLKCNDEPGPIATEGNEESVFWDNRDLFKFDLVYQIMKIGLVDRFTYIPC